MTDADKWNEGMLALETTAGSLADVIRGLRKLHADNRSGPARMLYRDMAEQLRPIVDPIVTEWRALEAELAPKEAS